MSLPSLPGVRYVKQGQVAWVTLDRPKKLNAMDLAMHESLKYVWDDFASDDSLRVAVLQGAGGKAFSVGQDLQELTVRVANGESSSSFGSEGRAGYPRLTERFELTKPVIASVDGYAYGGGFELALACDIIVATEQSSFALPEAKLGLIAGAGGVFRLLRQLPGKAALGYLLTGRQMSASRAFDFGLVNEVVENGQLDASVLTWVEQILQCAPHSIQAIKQISQQSSHLSLQQAFNEQYSCEKQRMQSYDCIEGPTAFNEKRPPVWGKNWNET
jgi:crotonobetainyl-CoA hydratase/dehydration protein DpgD